MKPACATVRRLAGGPAAARHQAPLLWGAVVVLVAAAGARAADAGPADALDGGRAGDAGFVLGAAAPPSTPPSTPDPPPTPAELNAPVVEDAGPVAADGGATIVDAGPAEARPEFPVSYRESDSPLTFRESAGGKDAKGRAAQASQALSAALEAEPPASDVAAEVVVDGDVAVVRVRGRVIATLYAEDATADGAPTLERYADLLETRLDSYVSAQLRRSSVQSMALHLFVSVFLCVLVLLTLRALHAAFKRWELAVESRERAFAPLKVFEAPLLSGDALRGLLVVALWGARIFAYVATVVVGLAAIFSQFELTQPLLPRIGSWALSPVLTAIDAIVGAVPGVILAAILLLGARAGLRVVELLLDGVLAGRVKTQWLDKPRVPAVRSVVVVAFAVVFAPLAVAAAFGRFGTPLETLALWLGGALAVATVPALSSAVVGFLLIWRGSPRAGEWLEIGGRTPVRGEVTRVDFLGVVLVPEAGGSVMVPTLLFVVLPVTRLAGPPRVELSLRVTKDRASPALLAALDAIVKGVDEAGAVSVSGVGATSLDVVLSVPATRASARKLLVDAVLAATDAGTLVVADGLGS